MLSNTDRALQHFQLCIPSHKTTATGTAHMVILVSSANASSSGHICTIRSLGSRVLVPSLSTLHGCQFTRGNYFGMNHPVPSGKKPRYSSGDNSWQGAPLTVMMGWTPFCFVSRLCTCSHPHMPPLYVSGHVTLHVVDCSEVLIVAPVFTEKTWVS